MKKRLFAIAVCCIMVIGLVAGCGSKSSESESEDSNADSAEGEVTTLSVLVPNDWENYGYPNEDGELEGYEVAVLQAVDEMLDDYTFDIQGIGTDDVAPMLSQVAEGRVDMALCGFEYTEERAENYLFGEVGYNDFSTYVMCLKDAGYTSLESLAGGTIGDSSESDPCVAVVRDYNEENPDKAINVDIYGDIGKDVEVQGLKEGKWDAVMHSRDTAYDMQAQFDNIFDIGDQVCASEAYFVYTKDAGLEDAQKAIDGALKQLKEDGTLDKIHEEWLGFPAYGE